MIDRAAVLLCDIAAYGNIGISADATVGELLSSIHKNEKGAVVILEGREQPVGILTERDAVRLIYDGIDRNEPVKEFAKKTVITAMGDRTIGYAMDLMLENNIRRLVVVDEMGIFLGLVTQQDLLIHLEDDFYRTTIKAKHIQDLVRDLIYASPDESIKSALEKIIKENISAVPILQKGKTVGIIAEKDILDLANKKVSFGDKVGLYMTSPVECVEMDTKLVDIVKIQNSKNIKRVILCDEKGMAVGIITSRDLVRNLEGDYQDFLERKLTYTKEVLNLLPEMLLELVDTGEDQLVLWCNDKVINRFGEGIIDRSVTRLVPAGRWKDICSTLRKQGKIEDVRYKKDGAVFEFSGFYLPMDRVNEIGRIQLIMRDITEEVMLATTDPLTSVYNRRFMNEFLTREIQRCRRVGKEFAVVLVDLDDFKEVNDTYGHYSGDMVLKAIVGMIMCGTREYDVVGRYGGEEFLIILPEVDRLSAKVVAERIRQEIEGSEIEIVNKQKVRITASLGGACYDADGESADDLLVKADARMYKAKKAGKNMVLFE
ncbi:MAG: diguanylate cyclase [bacterium]